MSTNSTGNGIRHHPHSTVTDEMNLAEERARRRLQSQPDSLEVHDDSLAILSNTVVDLQRRLLTAAAVIGAVVFSAFAVGTLIRNMKQQDISNLA